MNKPIGILVKGREAKEIIMEVVESFSDEIGNEQVENADDYVISIQMIDKSIFK